MTTLREHEVGHAVEIPPELPEDLQVLIKARENIARPGAFLQGSTGDSSELACSLGHVIYARFSHAADIKALKRLDDVSGCIITYNDTHTQEEVVAMFDKAIEQGMKELSS